MSAAVPVAVLGGTGLYAMEGLEDVREVELETPYGAPSAPILVGTVAGRQVAFLARHGRHHTVLPGEVNYRANLYALKTLGVERILSASAVGSMREEIRPRDVVLVDQFIDRTRQRPSTFFGEGIAGRTARDRRPLLVEDHHRHVGVVHAGPHRLRRIHMAGGHEPARFVGPDRQQGQAVGQVVEVGELIDGRRTADPPLGQTTDGAEDLPRRRRSPRLRGEPRPHRPKLVRHEGVHPGGGGQPIETTLDDGEVVRDDHRRPAAGSELGVEYIENLALAYDVEPGHRLVGHERMVARRDLGVKTVAPGFGDNAAQASSLSIRQVSCPASLT